MTWCYTGSRHTRDKRTNTWSAELYNKFDSKGYIYPLKRFLQNTHVKIHHCFKMCTYANKIPKIGNFWYKFALKVISFQAISTKFGVGRESQVHVPPCQISPLWLWKCGVISPKIVKIIFLYLYICTCIFLQPPKLSKLVFLVFPLSDLKKFSCQISPLKL